MSHSRLRVLLLAEACNPQWASVPLVGYSLARALSQRADLEITVATHVRNRGGLISDELSRAARIEFIDNEWIAGPMHRLGRMLRGGSLLGWTTNMACSWPGYMAFERRVWRDFRKELETGRFDLVHRITPVSPTLGSPLASRSPVPMILGPLNGGLPWPREFPELRGREKEWLVPVRKLHRFLPYYRSTYRHAAAVISGSRHTASEIPAYFGGERFYLPENAIDPSRFPVSEEWSAPVGRFQFVTASRLVPYKGTELILDAMGGSKVLRECRLVIFGDGPERSALEDRARRQGIEGCVEFRGWQAQEVISAEMRRSQAFVFPSLREFGGAVVLESMACGLPSIVVNYGGPGELAVPEPDVLVAMQPREGLVGELRSKMERLAGDSQRCRELSAAGLERVRSEFTWSAKGERVVEIYRHVLSRGSAAWQQQNELQETKSRRSTADAVTFADEKRELVTSLR